MAIEQWNGKPLSLKVIGTNAGTSMDGLDIAHIHYTQESPDAPLKMRLLREGEVPFGGALKGKYPRRSLEEMLLRLIPDRVMHLIRTNKTSPEEISMVNVQVGKFYIFISARRC